MGTFLFTRLRKWLGLERTGVIAFVAEVSCLTLAVASVWAPGSPFDPHFATSTPTVVCNLTSVSDSNVSVSNETVTPCDTLSHVQSVNVSVILLLVGIILSRVGE